MPQNKTDTKKNDFNGSSKTGDINSVFN